MIKNSAKSKYILSGYGITFDGAGEWSFDDDFAKIVVIFSVDNSSSIHTNNHKKQFLSNGRLTDDIDDTVGVAEKGLVLTLLKAKAKLYFDFA